MILKQIFLLAVVGLFTVVFVFSCSVDNNGNGSSSNSIEKNYSSSEFISSSSENGINSSSSKFVVSALLEPVWPLRNIKVSSIKNFRAYISSLDQPELDVSFGKERIILDPLEEINENCESISLDFMDMSAPSKSGNGYLLGLNSERNYSSITKECKYIWKTEIGNSNMDVSFTLDTTPPIIELNAANSINPLAWFKSNEALKLVLFILKDMDGTILAFNTLSNLFAREWSVRLNDLKNIDDNKNLSSLNEGKYEIVAYAFDGSTASTEQYYLLNRVAGGDSTIFALLDKGNAKYTGMNFSMKSDTIIVDSKK